MKNRFMEKWHIGVVRIGTVVLSSTLSLVGCGENTSILQSNANIETIEIIETTETIGLDKIIEANKPEATVEINEPSDTNEITVPFALMTGNQLYLDTGYCSGVSGRCGNMDGNIQGVVSSSQFPTENGQANFEGADSWQMGAEEDTLDVFFEDGSVHIFAVEGTKGEDYIPKEVLRFMGEVIELTEDHCMVVQAWANDEPMFWRRIQEGGLYKVSLDTFEPDMENMTLMPHNIVTIYCAPDFIDSPDVQINPETTMYPELSIIQHPYHIYAVHGNTCIRAEEGKDVEE